MNALRFAFSLTAAALFAVICAAPRVHADQVESYDYFVAERQMIRNGVQAVLMCNGLFTSHRPLDLVFSQELRYLDDPVGRASGGGYDIENASRSVVVGGGEHGTSIRAAFREGIGCVVMAPDQTAAEIDELPEIPNAAPARDVSAVPWPDGDALTRTPKACVTPDGSALCAAARWAFERETPEQTTLSLLVVHKGDIVLERYADGVDYTTRTRTWSTAKSIGVTLIG
ncbi:MAG: serine hydrolase, partial [Gammaproteobacteria bacterium]